MILSDKTQNSFYGVIVKVENLDVCRSFYRDIIGLGVPVMDSNFWVEFKLQDDVSLVLEQAIEGERLPVGRGRVSWLYRVNDIETVLERLREHGYEPYASEQERLGYRVFMFFDPEGNPFHLYSGKNSSEK